MPMQFFFFDFVNISNFDWTFYVFEIKYSGKNFVKRSNFLWIMICRMRIYDEAPFKPIIIGSIFNFNQTFLGWSNSFENLMSLLPVEELYFEILIV